MNISELSIRRPVLATVLTIIILLFGFIGYNYLGVREYPSVDNPIISVSCSYPGANADVIENQITEPLEQNINGIPGIRSMSSVSSQGQSRITVEFELTVDLETAANDVRDKVSRAQRYLPRDCDPPTVSKADADASPILMVAIQSNTRSLLELSEIADLTVKEQLQTIPDVSSVSIWGEKRYSMRLWLDPVKMAGYGITPVDVKNAINDQNLELPSGSIEGNTMELTLRTMGQMHTAKEFNGIILKEQNGQVVRFSDIGYAELGPADIKSYMKMNGVPMVGVVVIPQPGANHIDIADAVYERMEQMQKDLPDDVEYTYGFDNTRFIRASIAEVESTVYEAFVLVIIIIFLFLRDWRVTLIPCIVIPVSLIGAFFVMYVAGFSINVLTMLAVVLSVGLVVDDAIVMTENIYIRIERGMKPFEAGIEGAKEIFFAVISTTITLAAVFIPIVFMEGTSGRLFREFSFVVAGSVIISAFAALTFTPMLATKLLKHREKQNWFYRKTEPFFEGMNRIYSRSLNAFLRKRVIAIPFTLITLAIIGYLWGEIPAEMAPLEDRSQINIRTRAAEGASYEYIRDYTEEINMLVDSIVPDAAFVTARVSSGSGNIQVTLKDIKERDYTQMQVAEQISKAIRTHTKARSFVQQQSSFGGRRSSMPVQYVLQAVSIEKQMLKKGLEDEINDKRIYCLHQANREFFGDSPAGVRQEGYLEEVEGLTPEQLTAAYYEMLRTANIELLVLGCTAEQTAAVKDALLAELAAIDRAPLPLAENIAMPRREPVHKTETYDMVQAKLCMLFTLGEPMRTEQLAAVRLAMALYGGSVTSRLFLNVRERDHLCYYCSSSFQSFTGSMAVNSGVEHADAARAEQAILKELADLCDGPITDDEFEDCRRGLLSGMQGVEDTLGGIETWYYIEVLRGGDPAKVQTPAEARAALQAVTKDDVRAILRKLTLSVSYLLTKEVAAHAAE